MEMNVPEPVRQAAANAGAQAGNAGPAALGAAAAQALLAHAGRQGGGRQVLCFTAAGDTYAIGIAAIKEIIEYGTLTRIPLMPSFIRGVINLRGAVVPVIDLSARLGFEPAAPSRRTCIVIVEMRHEGESFDLGLVVDGVSEVLELAAQDLEPTPSFGTAIRTDFIEAMARIRGRFVIVMRLEQVLSIQEVSELARQRLEQGA